jgi:hypothetical protein
MAIDEKSFLVAEQRRLESNQPGSTWFYLRHPKVTVFWLLVLIGFAAFIAFKN